MNHICMYSKLHITHHKYVKLSSQHIWLHLQQPLYNSPRLHHSYHCYWLIQENHLWRVIEPMSNRLSDFQFVIKWRKTIFWISLQVFIRYSWFHKWLHILCKELTKVMIWIILNIQTHRQILNINYEDKILIKTAKKCLVIYIIS